MKQDFQVDRPFRLFVLVVSIVMWLGIWLTGFAVVHWLLYIPAVFLLAAAIFGICPGMFFSRLLVKRIDPDQVK